ncbi:glycoside hydrolase family 27 protein [Natronosporangium hydrolyticum]|nr:glycoside hydrolase family 27 protein [Natronosporangium hydrolyticum]
MDRSPPLASTPPMGWNSWDCFGTSVTEDEVRGNALVMADRLADVGWEYVVVDIQWYEPSARAGGYRPHADLVLDEVGRPLPAPNRFPSAAGGLGFRPLADYVHSLGLKFGVHVLRGIPRPAVEARVPVLGTEVTAAEVADRRATSTWITDNFGLDHRHPGAQAYYDSLLALFAEWGVDYVKADDMIAPYWAADVEAFALAIERCGRPMVLSLSPGTDLPVGRAEHLAKHAQLWRISGDLWDRWEDVAAQFDRLAAWAPYAGPEAWPDADMLPLGRIGIRAEVGEARETRLTVPEQVTMLSLWSIARSPLMLGCDLTSTDPSTLTLLTNPEVVTVLREGSGAREVYRAGSTIAWTATAPRGHYLAVFHTGPAAAEVCIPWAELGISRPARLRDLWQRRDLPVADPLRLTLDRHGAALLRCEPS